MSAKSIAAGQWGKRLLQHERSGMEARVTGSASGGGEAGLVAEARRCLSEDAGRIADPACCSDVLVYEMNNRVFRLAQRRAVEEFDGGTPGPVTSIFKIYGSELQLGYYDLVTRMRGVSGFGAASASFSAAELETTRRWLCYRAGSIYSGSNEIQRNIIAKRGAAPAGLAVGNTKRAQAVIPDGRPPRADRAPALRELSSRSQRVGAAW